ncbi:MAG: RNB domain-containing ribonuclease, partial [Desulfatitalea sp.]|nr:RNB domain-containing ribonuclease [Desulfatitalea sp.]
SKSLRLRLLTENNREVKLSAGRLTHRSKVRLDPSIGRDKLVAQLKAIAARRRELSVQVDIPTLWEVLQAEQEWIDLDTMTAFCFPEQSNGDHESAVIRAFFNDRLYFKFSPEQFFPYSAQKVEQIIAQQEARERRERLVEQGGAWLQHVLKGQAATPPESSDDIIAILKGYCLFDKESPDQEAARAILKKAGANAPSAIFTFMVSIGAWHPDENLDLLRHGIGAPAPPAVEARAAALCQHPPTIQAERRDLRDLPLMTIDGPATLDFDDAISIVPRGDHWRVGIHIIDVGQFVSKGDPIDQEAIGRASSIYLPDRRIAMLPECLALEACSLKAGEDRPAISTLATVTAQGTVVDFEIVPSLIRVRRNLTFQEVDDRINADPDLAALLTIARSYRDQRLNNGAMIIRLPEINLWLNDDGEPEMVRVDAESPSHLLVAELMIMANDLAARFLTTHQVPAVFRAQANPRERLFNREEGTLFQNWMQRKLLSRFALGSAAEPHSGLGLPAYVTCTSPIRKYYDLVTQRQLRAALGLETPYSAAEIDFIIAALAEPMGLVGRLQFRRNRYWLLKLLEQRIGAKYEAIVLNKFRDNYAILLPDYLIECQLSGADAVTLKPEDLVRITIQHVHARNDVITVYLG